MVFFEDDRPAEEFQITEMVCADLGKRKDMPKFLAAFCLFLLCGCGATLTDFVRSGREEYPSKPEEYDVLVFFEGDLPTEEFEMIGMVYAEKEADSESHWDLVRPEEIVQLLKEVARKNGADAIVDVKITSAEHKTRDWKRGEAKAIIFIE